MIDASEVWQIVGDVIRANPIGDRFARVEMMKVEGGRLHLRISVDSIRFASCDVYVGDAMSTSKGDEFRIREEVARACVRLATDDQSPA